MAMTAVPSKEAALAAIDQTQLRAGQRWRHYKTGGVYQVIATAILESTLEPAVVYAGKDGVVWVRSMSIFLGRARQGDALVPRFTLIEG